MAETASAVVCPDIVHISLWLECLHVLRLCVCVLVIIPMLETMYVSLVCVCSFKVVCVS